MVTLVIPGRNVAATAGDCLAAATRILQRGGLAEIIFVDDGSTDETAAVVSRFPARIIGGPGRGAGAARNLGWRAATSDLIWFLDADCVPDLDSLDVLLEHMRDDSVWGAGGSFQCDGDETMSARLITEEIVERHRRMPARVNFLATGNVVYRRAALERVGGFDERFLKAHDAELAYRVRNAGGELAFDRRSRVTLTHPPLEHYLKVQQQQGYWRMLLYSAHPRKMGGDSYSGLLDHVQPLLAFAALLCLPLLFTGMAWIEAAWCLALLVAQGPMTLRLVRRMGDARFFLFAPFAWLRAFFRCFGMLRGGPSLLTAKLAR